MRILVVDNGGQWTHREWRVLKYLDVDTEIIPNTTSVEDLDADGLVLSGGAARIGTESAKLGLTHAYLDKLEIPIFGICVGFQFLVEHFGGDAGPAKIPEYGETTLHVDESDLLFANIPKKTFTVWESHNDEVKKLTDEFKLLAHSDNCPVQAVAHKKKPLWGVQFHPEVEHTEFGNDMFKNFIAVCKK